MKLSLRRLIHWVYGHGSFYEMGYFYSRCCYCQLAWGTTSSGGDRRLADAEAYWVLNQVRREEFG